MRFSIVTICLNPGRYLKETIDSVLQQDFADLEYVLIDGGSTDGSVEMISEFAAGDSRIVWESSPDEGIADAMNRGIHRCRGEILSFLHADDRYPDSTILSKVNDCFKNEPEALWLTGGVCEIDTHGRTVRELSARTFSYRRLLRNNIVYHPSTFVCREVFDRVGPFNTRLQYAMDYDLWLRLGRLSAPIVTKHLLAEFRVHQGSLSSANRLDALDEEYQVRCKYSHGWLGKLGHAFYQSWRRGRC